MIDRPPEIHPLAGDPNDHLFEMPPVAWPRAAPSQPSRDYRSELEHPARGPTLRPQRRAAVQLTLALLEQPAAPAMPGVPLDLEARAKAIEILVRIIAQTLATSTQLQNETADE